MIVSSCLGRKCGKTKQAGRVVVSGPLMDHGPVSLEISPVCPGTLLEPHMEMELLLTLSKTRGGFDDERDDDDQQVNAAKDCNGGKGLCDGQGLSEQGALRTDIPHW
jgi:hypothetical protein